MSQEEALLLALNKALPAAQLYEFGKWTSVKPRRTLHKRITYDLISRRVRANHENIPRITAKQLT